MKNRTYIVCVVLCLISCTGKIERINKEIGRSKKHLPKLLTNELQIDSMVFSAERNTLEYYYTVFNDSIALNCDYVNTQKDMANEIKKHPSLELFRNQKVIFEYIYISAQSKNILLKVAVPESMYK